MVSSLTNFVGGIVANSFAYSFDAIGRPVRRNADTFSYNARGALCAETVDGHVGTHVYDLAGNLVTDIWVSATISVWNSRCEKRLSMTISNAFTVESMLRNPITRNPTITYPFLMPVTTHFCYDVTERLTQ